MRVPRLTIGATLALAIIMAACASSGDATLQAGAAASPDPSAPATPTASTTPAPTVASTLAALPSPEAMTQLWEAHGPVTDRTSTTYIAINPIDGNIWVGVPFENRYWILSPDGTYLESWGEGGEGPGQFDFSDHQPNPNGFAPIAFAPDGSYYVGDTGNDRVQHFAPDRSYLGEWGSFGAGDGSFVQIVSIATDGTTVYVGDGDHYNVQAFMPDGTYLRTLGEAGGYSSVVVGRGGRVYLTNTDNPPNNPPALLIANADGTEVSMTVLPVASADALQPVTDAAGNVYVSFELDGYPWTAKGIVKLDADGQVLEAWEGGGDFIGVDPDGKGLYVARGIQLDSTQWTVVRKYAPSGS